MKKNLDYYLNLPYTITVKRLDDGDYFAQYADIGLTKNNLMAGWGKSEAEAISDLKSAFKDALAQMLSDNEEIIEPKLLSHKTKSYTITMKENIMQEIDAAAKELGISRSAFLAISAKNYIRALQ